MQANIHFQSAKDLSVDADHIISPDDDLHAWVSIQDPNSGSMVIHVHDIETLDKLAFHLTSFARQLRTEAEMRESRHSYFDEADVQHHLIEPTGDLNEEPLRSGYDA